MTNTETIIPPIIDTTSESDPRINRITNNLVSGMIFALRNPPVDQTPAIDHLKEVFIQQSQGVEMSEIFQQLSLLQKSILTQQIEALTSLEEQFLNNSFQPAATTQSISSHSRLVEITTPRLQAITACRALVRSLTPTQ